MIIITAGHTGAHTGAQCATTQFDEGRENIWLRNRIAEILTNKYGLVVLEDDDNTSLSLVTKQIEKNTTTEDIVIDIHFNAHSNPQAHGTEAIVADDATTLELRFATHLTHTIAETLGIPLRSIKTESETPHHRLGILHIKPQSIILEICFCTSPSDVEAYRKNINKLANTLAQHIVKLLNENGEWRMRNEE